MKWPMGSENQSSAFRVFSAPVVGNPHLKEAKNGQRRPPQQARQALERNVRKKEAQEKAKNGKVLIRFARS
jgi:hypothetical protein